MPRKTRKAWTAPSLQDFNVVSRKRLEPDPDIMDSGILEPKSLGDLAIHPRKVAEVRKWIAECLHQRSRILLISGPPGSGKTITLRLVADAEDFSISEWISPVSKTVEGNFLEENFGESSGFYDISEGKKFEDFICRSGRYPCLFHPKRRTLVLVKDIPNIFIWKPDLFHSFLERYVGRGKSPIAFIVTDDENMDLHTSLFPNELKAKLGVTVIKFNPVSDTFLKKNLRNISEKIKGTSVSSECLERITKNAIGDIRSATTEVMVQLRLGETDGATIKKRKHESITEENGKEDVSSPSSSVRDHGYDFFKKMGRVLYPKRTADPGTSSTVSNLVHNILDIADNWSKSNLSFLHENYLKTFGKLEDVANAADCFTFCDFLSRHKEIEGLNGIVAIAGLMSFNTEPKKSGFHPFKKSTNLHAIKDWKCSFNERIAARFGVEERVFALDVAPMKKWLPATNVDPSVRTLTSAGNAASTALASFLPPNPENTKTSGNVEKANDGSESEEVEIEEVED